jgi:predicted transposase YbfD/YdcC
MATTTQSVAILHCFEELPDPRRTTDNKLHLLIDIVVIALCATIAGCESFVEMEEFGRQKLPWFKKFLRLPHGMPSHDTLRRVLSALDTRKFHECFGRWVNALHEVTAGDVVAIDGKTIRRSFDRAKGIPALHVVTAWAEENQLVLGQIAVDSKSNEITAMPKLLEILAISGAIVTIDAMGCQTEMAQKIREQGADYVLAVKDNQPHLADDLQEHFLKVVQEQEQLPRRQRYPTKEKNRGRLEERFYYATAVPEGLRNQEQWRDLQSVGWVISWTTRQGEPCSEVRGYISSLKPDAKNLARAVRGHWGIENRQHWVLDVVFNEDQSRARKANATENLALLRRLALNLLRCEGTKKASLRVKRRAAGWNDQLLEQILTAGTT